MTRYRAFLIHLLGSVFLLLLNFVLIYQIWYPANLFWVASGYDLLGLLIIVDVIVGPLIMLIIFDTKKKYLKFDILVILLLQIGFMGYGLWITYTTRPVYFAFAENRFVLVKADQIEAKALNAVKDERFKSLPMFGPLWVGTKEPDDAKARNDLVFASFAGMGIQDLPQYFVPFDQVVDDVKKASKSSQEIVADSDNKKRLVEYEKKHADKKMRFIVMVNKLSPLYVAIDPDSGKVIDII
jgi:hypothetical protein